jgi:hypothetical protein
MKEKISLYFLLKRNIDIPCILFKLVPLAMVVRGTASRGWLSTSGGFQPARQIFSVKGFLQLGTGGSSL